MTDTDSFDKSRRSGGKEVDIFTPNYGEKGDTLPLLIHSILYVSSVMSTSEFRDVYDENYLYWNTFAVDQVWVWKFVRFTTMGANWSLGGFRVSPNQS